MRSGVLAAVIAVAIGCTSPGGVQFDLDASADQGADELLVYVGGGAGKDASIALQNEAPSDLNKGTFFPDVHGSVEVFRLTASQRTATLSFVPGDRASILTIVAIGMTGGQPSSFAALTTVPLNSNAVLVWKVALKPLEDSNGSTAGAVARWGKEAGDHYCVRVTDHARDQPMFANVVIGIEGDKDCDDIPEFENGVRNKAECDDEWQFAKIRPSASTLTCMDSQQVTDPVGTPFNICTLGGPACDDGRPLERSACSLGTPFCAPLALCSQCRQATFEERFECALELDPTQSNMPHLRCPLELDISVNPPRMCPSSLSIKPPAGWVFPTTACTATPMFHTSDRDASWSATAEIGGVRVTFANPGIPASPCALSVSAAIPPNTQVERSRFPEHGLLSLDLATLQRGLVVPVVLDLDEVTVCSPARECPYASASVDGSVPRCLMAAPVSN